MPALFQRSAEVVRQIQHRLSGRPYGKLLPRHAGSIAQFLFTHPKASRDDLLDFIETAWGFRVSKVALWEFLKKYGLDRDSLSEAPTPVADEENAMAAIESLEDLGVGFSLATHDLEIRGAGELLGDTQSGQMQEIGFSLYTEMLGRAVESLKAGREPDLEGPLDAGVDINLHIPALLPDDYVPDVHLRLILYKRISAADSADDLRELQVELIDRFGLLPDGARNLLRIAGIKKLARRAGIEKIDAADSGGYLLFGQESRIDPVALIQLVQNDSRTYKLQGSHRLQFRLDLSDLDTRFALIEKLLGQLAVKEPRAMTG